MTPAQKSGLRVGGDFHENSGAAQIEPPLSGISAVYVALF